MEHGDVIFRFFLPSDEDAAEAVEPGVCSFDDPASGLVAGFAFDVLRFFSAAADVRGETEFSEKPTDFVRVVAFVQTHSLRFFCGRLWTSYHDRFYRRFG